MAELSHYGVKGMKWGVTRSEKNARNANYTSSQRSYDKRNLGKGGVKRVNRHLNEGHDLKTARGKARSTRNKRNVALAGLALASPEILKGAAVAAKLVGNYAALASQHTAARAETNRGRASAAASMGLPRTASTGPDYAKKSRGGAYKVTSL